MLTHDSSVLLEEILRAQSAGMLTLAELAIEIANNRLYSSPLSLCSNGIDKRQEMHSLYLNLYALIGKVEQQQQGAYSVGYIVPGVPGVPGVVAGSIASSTYVLEFNTSALQAGQITIISPRFIGLDVTVIRGALPVPGIVMPGGQYYYTKIKVSDTITLSHPLVEGEYIKVTTIPL